MLSMKMYILKSINSLITENFQKRTRKNLWQEQGLTWTRGKKTLLILLYGSPPKRTKVDGIYSADPNIEKDAQLFDFLSYDQVIEGKLNVMDANAIVLCRDQGMPIRVFNVFGSGNLMQIVRGEKVGTLVH